MHTIAVLGLGQVGTLAAELLNHARFSVLGLDIRPPPTTLPFATAQCDLTDTVAMRSHLEGMDAVLSCLPFSLNAEIAKLAHAAGIHYFDLTEDVATTASIKTLSESARGVMAPQCGLAPGFVGMVAAQQIAELDTCRSCRLRVGALPQNPSGLMGYAFNWSPAGVVNEYLNDCEVIEDGKHKWVSAMEWLETLYVDGVKLEAFTTSGGLGTLCETYLGQVANIDYKTLRYPGHAELMNFFFHELLMRDRRAEAGDILVNAKPPTDADVVHVHVATEGTQRGALRRREFVRSYRPKHIAGARRTAISWTTAASVASVIEMVRAGDLPQRGFLRQEQVPLARFLATQNGGYFDDTPKAT